MFKVSHVLKSILHKIPIIMDWRIQNPVAILDEVMKSTKQSIQKRKKYLQNRKFFKQKLDFLITHKTTVISNSPFPLERIAIEIKQENN